MLRPISLCWNVSNKGGMFYELVNNSTLSRYSIWVALGYIGAFLNFLLCYNARIASL